MSHKPFSILLFMPFQEWGDFLRWLFLGCKEISFLVVFFFLFFGVFFFLLEHRYTNETANFTLAISYILEKNDQDMLPFGEETNPRLSRKKAACFFCCGMIVCVEEKFVKEHNESLYKQFRFLLLFFSLSSLWKWHGVSSWCNG